MDRVQLKDYLKGAVDLETAIFSCDDMINRLEKEVSRKVLFKDIPQVKYPEEPKKTIPKEYFAGAAPQLYLPEPPVKEEFNDKACAQNYSGLFPYHSLIDGYFSFMFFYVLPGAMLTALPIYIMSRLGSNIDYAMLDNIAFMLPFGIFGFGLTTFFHWFRSHRYNKRRKEYVKNCLREHESRWQNTYGEYCREKEEAERKYAEGMRLYEQRKIDVARKNKEAIQYAESKTRLDMENWQKEKELIDARQELIVATDRKLRGQDFERRVKIRKLMAAISKKREVLAEKLQKYYALDIVYPSYRNLLAITQIFEYIDSGICTELEGPNGAYAEYMKDVRTNAIKTSIEDLRKDMVSGFKMIGGLQHAILHELEESNKVLFSIEMCLGNMWTDFSDKMDSIYDAVLETGYKIGDRIEDMSDRMSDNMEMVRSSAAAAAERMAGQMEALRNSAEQTNRKLSEINNNTHAAAMNTALVGFNQYLDMKSRGVDGYYGMYCG